MAKNSGTKGKNMKSGMTEYRKSFQDHHDNVRAPRRQAFNSAARESMGDGYKTDINQYDHAAYGNKKFDMKDVKHLRKSGYSNADIKKYTSGLSADQFSEGMRLNQKRFAGEHFQGNMTEGAKISDHDVGKGFNVADVNYLRRQGFSDQEIAKHAHSSVTEDGKRHGNAMSKFMDEQGMLDYKRGAWKDAKERASGHKDKVGKKPPTQKDPMPTIPDTSGNKTEVKSGAVQQTQMVSQNNDINTAINGSNNYTNINQDNSVRQYGGDTRIFNYQGGKDGRTDTPVSAATMGGFYDVDDSPAKQAKFMDLYSTLNRDAQKQYSDTSSIAQGAINRARQNESLDINAMDKRIKDREMYSRAKADVMGGNIFGDMFNFEAPKFQMPTPEKPVKTPNFEKLYDKYTDF